MENPIRLNKSLLIAIGSTFAISFSFYKVYQNYKKQKTYRLHISREDREAVDEVILNIEKSVSDLNAVENPLLISIHNHLLGVLNELKEFQKNSNLSEDNSDSESFLSAVESFSSCIDNELEKNADCEFLCQSLEYQRNKKIPHRKLRTDLLQCENDVDFLAKLRCIRIGFDKIFSDEATCKQFLKETRDLGSNFFRAVREPFDEYHRKYDCLTDYVSNTDEKELVSELSDMKIYPNFFDIVIDFILIDAFVKLGNPPSAVTTVMRNTWLPESLKKTTLSSTLWAIVKAKSGLLSRNDGFLVKFYDLLYEFLCPLAWGFLGPDKDLNKFCDQVKDILLDYTIGIFTIASEDSIHAISYQNEEEFTQGLLEKTKFLMRDLEDLFIKRTTTEAIP